MAEFQGGGKCLVCLYNGGAILFIYVLIKPQLWSSGRHKEQMIRDSISCANLNQHATEFWPAKFYDAYLLYEQEKRAKLVSDENGNDPFWSEISFSFSRVISLVVAFFLQVNDAFSYTNWQFRLFKVPFYYTNTLLGHWYSDGKLSGSF